MCLLHLVYIHTGRTYTVFKTMRNHRLRPSASHFSTGMLVWWNVCSVRAAAYIILNPQPVVQVYN